jgi:hypothetical protein
MKEKELQKSIDTAGIRKTVTALHDKAVEVVGTGIRIYKEKEVRVRL